MSFKVRENEKVPNVRKKKGVNVTKEPQHVVNVQIPDTYFSTTVNLEKEQQSIEKLYIDLDNAEKQLHLAREKFETSTESIKKMELQLEQSKNQVIQEQLNMSRFYEIVQSTKTNIEIERKKITSRHQETIMKLRGKKDILSDSLGHTKPISNLSEKNEKVPPEIVQYRNKLRAHMRKYSSNPWHSLFLFVLSHHPMENNKEAIDFINNIPNTPVAEGIRDNCTKWLNTKQDSLSRAVRDKYSFVDFAIILKNFIHKLKKQPTRTKKEIYKMFDISE